MGLRLFVASLFVVGALAAPTNAALVSITAATAVDAPDYDLTNVYGTSDWAYWAQTDGSIPAPVAPTNEKFGGTLISGISSYGGGGVRGTTSTTVPDYDFVFTNGTSTPSGTVNNLTGLFNTQLGSASVGVGVQLTVTAPTADPFNVYVWATVYGGTGALTADIGLVTATSPNYTNAGVRTPGRLYTIQVTPDSAGQALTLRYGLSAQTDATFANASISAVAVSTIPEPGTMGLLLGSGILVLGVWHRRRAQNAS